MTMPSDKIVFPKISLDFGATNVSLRSQIAGQIAMAIQTGKLKPSDRLPTVGELAKKLGVSTATVNGAYSELKIQHVLYIRRGFGTFVADEAANSTYSQMEAGQQLIQAIKRAKAAGLSVGQINNLVLAGLNAGNGAIRKIAHNVLKLVA